MTTEKAKKENDKTKLVNMSSNIFIKKKKKKEFKYYKSNTLTLI